MAVLYRGVKSNYTIHKNVALNSTACDLRLTASFGVYHINPTGRHTMGAALRPWMCKGIGWHLVIWGPALTPGRPVDFKCHLLTSKSKRRYQFIGPFSPFPYWINFHWPPNSQNEDAIVYMDSGICLVYGMFHFISSEEQQFHYFNRNKQL